MALSIATGIEEVAAQAGTVATAGEEMPATFGDIARSPDLLWAALTDNVRYLEYSNDVFGRRCHVLDEIEEGVLCREMVILADEAMKNHIRAEKADNDSQATMALAQVVICHMMMEYYLDKEDWSEFDDKLQEVIELQESLYREARLKNDRNFALITLARLRALTTLARRLANPTRQQAMIRELLRRRVLH